MPPNSTVRTALELVAETGRLLGANAAEATLYPSSELETTQAYMNPLLAARTPTKTMVKVPVVAPPTTYPSACVPLETGDPLKVHWKEGGPLRAATGADRGHGEGDGSPGRDRLGWTAGP